MGVEDLDLSLKCWTMGGRILHYPEAVVAHRFQKSFTGYSVNAVNPLANQLRTARKHFAPSVWDEWVVRAHRRKQHLQLQDHPEGLWAHAWQLFQRFQQSAEHERTFLLTHRRRDEFWYAQRFERDWPALGESSTSKKISLLAKPKPLFAVAEASPSPPPCSAPEVDSVDPDTGVQGNTIGVTFSGENLAGCNVTSPSGSITITVNEVTDTEIDTTFQIDMDAPAQDYSISVINACGVDFGTFTVIPPPPEVDSVDPESGAQGQTVAVTIDGQNLVPATIGSIDGITVEDIVSTIDEITANFVIAPDATVGDRTFTVTTPGGSDTGSFAVTQGLPQVNSVDPDNNYAGTSGRLTISGYCFNGASVSASSDLGLSGATVTSDTSITADYAIPDCAPPQTVEITVTNSVGSDTGDFAINPRTVTISSFSFGGSGLYDELYTYPALTHVPPNWTSGSASQAVYQINSMVVFASPVLTISPPMTQSCAVSIRVQNEGTTLAQIDGVAITGSSVTLNDMTASSALSAQVMVDSYVFNWEISYDDGSTWLSIGDADDIELYWIVDTPSTANNQVYDLALLNACNYVNGSSDYAGSINSGISGAVYYDPGLAAPTGYNDNSGGVLMAYTAGAGNTFAAMCATNAYLLQYLLNSIGATSGNVEGYWGGTSTSNLTNCWAGTTVCGSVSADRPAKGNAGANPRFIYHAMLLLSGTVYDPSYGVTTTSPSSAFSNFCPSCTYQTSDWNSFLPLYPGNSCS